MRNVFTFAALSVFTQMLGSPVATFTERCSKRSVSENFFYSSFSKDEGCTQTLFSRSLLSDSLSFDTHNGKIMCNTSEFFTFLIH